MATKKPSPATAPQPLLYANPTPLDAQKHADLAIKRNLNLNFCKGIHAVPVNLIEFPQLCHHYPIAFSPDDKGVPVAILGLTESENLFVNEDGTWAADSAYIPSYIRRYPFIFASITGSDQLTLCVDDDSNIFDAQSDLKLFGADGKPSALTNTALEFCKSFHAASLQTREFGAALAKSGLLVQREAEIPLPGGKAIRFGGFSIIDETKWANIDDKILIEWKKRGWLGGVYAHLFSGQQWSRLTRLYADRHLPKQAA